MKQQKINFSQERDFGSVFGDTVAFLKQNFKSFFACVIFIAGPFILAMSALYGYVQIAMLGNMNSKPTNPLAIFNQTYFLSIATMVIGGLIINILLSGITYNYLCLYNEKPFGERITISEVARRLWDNIGRFIISGITFILSLIFIIFIMVLIGIGIFSVSGIVAGVIIGLILFFASIIILPVFTYLVPASFYLVVRDNVFIYTAIGKVRNVLSGNFWRTWLIIIVTLICLGTIQAIFNLPATVLGMLKLFNRAEGAASANSMMLMVFYTAGMFLTYCTSSISHIIAAFNFMSHEEKHDGKGLQSKIKEII